MGVSTGCGKWVEVEAFEQKWVEVVFYTICTTSTSTHLPFRVEVVFLHNMYYFYSFAFLSRHIFSE